MATITVARASIDRPCRPGAQRTGRPCRRHARRLGLLTTCTSRRVSGGRGVHPTTSRPRRRADARTPGDAYDVSDPCGGNLGRGPDGDRAVSRGRRGLEADELHPLAVSSDGGDRLGVRAMRLARRRGGRPDCRSSGVGPRHSQSSTAPTGASVRNVARSRKSNARSRSVASAVASFNAPRTSTSQSCACSGIASMCS